MWTVDTPVAGARQRDGLTIPPSLSARTFAEGALHPGWWFDLLTTGPLEFAPLNRSEGTVADLVDRMFDPSATIADVTWLRSMWDGPLVVKGIQTVADARAVVDAGADAVIVSNHGGRQLDRVPPRCKCCQLLLMPWATAPRCTSTVGSSPAATS